MFNLAYTLTPSLCCMYCLKKTCFALAMCNTFMYAVHVLSTIGGNKDLGYTKWINSLVVVGIFHGKDVLNSALIVLNPSLS